MKDDMHQAGIRSDRTMTTKEIYTAAANYNAVKRAAERKYDPNSKFDRFCMRLELGFVILAILYFVVLIILTFWG